MKCSHYLTGICSNLLAVKGNRSRGPAHESSSKEWRKWCEQKGSVSTPQYVGEEATKFLDRDAEIQRPILEASKGSS